MNSEVEFPETDIEPVYQQIADGGDHFDHDKRLHEDKKREQKLRKEERIKPDRPLP
jgi:hypothetical protein